MYKKTERTHIKLNKHKYHSHERKRTPSLYVDSYLLAGGVDSSEHAL